MQRDSLTDVWSRIVHVWHALVEMAEILRYILQGWTICWRFIYQMYLHMQANLGNQYDAFMYEYEDDEDELQRDNESEENEHAHEDEIKEEHNNEVHTKAPSITVFKL